MGEQLETIKLQVTDVVSNSLVFVWYSSEKIQVLSSAGKHLRPDPPWVMDNSLVCLGYDYFIQFLIRAKYFRSTTYVPTGSLCYYLAPIGTAYKWVKGTQKYSSNELMKEWIFLSQAHLSLLPSQLQYTSNWSLLSQQWWSVPVSDAVSIFMIGLAAWIKPVGQNCSHIILRRSETTCTWVHDML